MSDFNISFIGKLAIPSRQNCNDSTMLLNWKLQASLNIDFFSLEFTTPQHYLFRPF